jgi:N-6 DNA methylase
MNAPLRECGYRRELLRTDFSYGQDLQVPLVAFAQAPADSRSACVAVLAASSAPRATVEDCRALGAPIVFVCFQNTLQWWKQGASAAELLESIPADGVERFFKSNIDKFSPEAVYRAKTWGRFQTSYQLSFVDMGLMPLIERQVGRSLGELIERNVSDLRNRLTWDEITDEQGQWLLQTVFWLVSAKILRDKQVQSFEDLDLGDVDEVFRRVGNHYGTKPLVAGSKKKAEALRESADLINNFSSLVLTTTEALAYVYENTLISKETRSALGTHSTPTFLVDYIVGHLAEWIQDIPINDRSVFEPSCGHAAFLVSAMRLLTELLPTERQMPSRRGPYLRSRLHGTDIDPFALELARLSLTLTDIPNPDGWDLTVQNMFFENGLAEQAQRNTILLANPPFDNFSPEEQQAYRGRKIDLRFLNKSAEMLWRTLPHLPEGGVFGIVLPQAVLHSDNARALRAFLVRECELKDICLLPDDVFSFSDAESAIIVGRRKKVNGQNKVLYNRIRERDLPSFRSDYSVLDPRAIQQSSFRSNASVSLRLPDLAEVWAALGDNPTLDDLAAVSKGLDYSGSPSPDKTTFSKDEFPGGRLGFVRFDRGLELHELPTAYWMNLDASVVSSPRSGTTCGTSQVLLNYAAASRGPWRLKALADREGHPVTSAFMTVRPTEPSLSIEMLWALLNSPVANAYAYSHLGRRHNLVGDIRQIPLPKRWSSDLIERAVIAYLSAAAAVETTSAKLHRLLLRIDAEVLKLYSLSFELEKRLLVLFYDWQRVGVSFPQTKFLPRPLDGRIRFSDFLDFEESWSETNRERGKLIDENISGEISHENRARLESLQVYADYYVQTVSPRSIDELDELERRLFGSPEKGRGG